MLAAWLLVHALTRSRFDRIHRPATLAWADILRFLVILAATVALDLLASLALWAASIDPRDSILGPFSVRNSLVVGIIMGFAIIPIIYTISEDAMRGVPQGLRQASLGSGATPWQTALRVVLPVAASGIFSACMIGLGRAVGETMIVLMATGNSPEMNWNIFSGFRTLAANIAVELPESDKGSTHYRVLFLCGLLLFALTFAVNTTAEVVRQYFRRKNAGL
jgi:phosphate transport system permease protein